MGHRSRQLAVLFPVLKRPQRVAPVLASLEAATPEPHRVLFIADQNDVGELEAIQEAGAEYLVIDKPGSWARKINLGYRETTEPWIFCGADDLEFHPDWFGRALRWLEREPRAGVIGTNDLCNGRTMTGEHSTHMLIRRSYADEFGTIDGEGIMHEGYRHEYADDEVVQTAMARDAYVHAFDSIVEHLHPLVGKAPTDPTYAKGRQYTVRSKQLFRRRRRLWRPS